jgi:hypothetical protein
VGKDRDIRFELHPGHTVEYQGVRIHDAKIINGVWYFRSGDTYERFPDQQEVRLASNSPDGTERLDGDAFS